MRLPREVFEDLMEPLQSRDVVGLQRDPQTAMLIPTKTTKTIRHFNYEVRKGSVSDRLFSPGDHRSPPKGARTDASRDDRSRSAAGWRGERVRGGGNPLEANGRQENRVPDQVAGVGRGHVHMGAEPAHRPPATVASFEGLPPPPPPMPPADLPPSRPHRGAGCARARLSGAEEMRGGVPQTMSMVCGNVIVQYKEYINELNMGVVKIVFKVLMLDKNGHITWPTDFAPATKAALRQQARALLRKMMDDPLNPVDETMAPALIGPGSDSIFRRLQGGGWWRQDGCGARRVSSRRAAAAEPTAISKSYVAVDRDGSARDGKPG